MSDPISLTITYERGLWRQAMTGWWRSVIPPEPFIKRAVIWAVIWGGVGFGATILYDDVLMIVALVALLPTIAIMLA